jgi:hypothetical protein
VSRFAGLLGIVSALMGFAFPIVFAAMDPAYDPARDFISELGAVGAPNAAIVNAYGFLPPGVLMIAFAILAWAVLPRSWPAFWGFAGIFLFAIGYVGAAFFPCDAGCRPASPSFDHIMHSLTGAPGYFLAPLFMAALAVAARRWPGGGWLSPLAAFGAAVSLAGLVNFLPESETAGLWQRVLEAGVLVWVLACGCYLLTRGKDARG